MYLQELLEVAIGLVFVWFIISMATMQIQEVIANLFSKRSRDLRNAIEGMLEDPEKVRELYNHPLIKGLAKPLSEAKSNALKVLRDKGWANLSDKEKSEYKKLERIPSYIPSKNFALALFDVVANAGTEKSPITSALKKVEDGINGITDEALKKQAKAASNRIYQLAQTAATSEAGSRFHEGLKYELKNQIDLLGTEYNLQPLASALNQEIDNSKDNLASLFKSELFLDQVQAGVLALGHNESLRKSLNSLLAGAEELVTDADKALAIGRNNVEEWFNNTMDRMSGWYKRWAQKLAFGIGLFLAIALNVDSVNIAFRLWQEPQIRHAYNLYIHDFMQQESLEITDTTPEGSDQKQYPGLDPADFDEIKTQLTAVGLPVGWNGVWYKEYLKDFWLKTLGFMITALATMQGANFWFDLLKKLINVRGSGANPAEKPKESKSDKES